MVNTTKERKWTRKPVVILVVMVIILIVGRLFLPSFLEYYVNKTLNNIPGYEGHVEDIDVNLWRKAYVINGLILEKSEAKSNTPMLDFEKSDISIEWKSLLDGRIVSEIILHGP